MRFPLHGTALTQFSRVKELVTDFGRLTSRMVEARLTQAEWRRPTWHSIIFFLGLSGIARGILAGFDLKLDGRVMSFIYAACVVGGCGIGHLFSGGPEGSRHARIVSAFLATTTFLIAETGSDKPSVAAVAGLATMYLGTGIREALAHLRLAQMTGCHVQHCRE